MTHQPPVSTARAALMTAALAVLLVGVTAAAGHVVRDLGDSQPVASPATKPPAPTSTQPTVTPSRNPHRQPDLDRGTSVEHGVFVEVAEGWEKQPSYGSVLRVASSGRGVAEFFVITNPLGSVSLLRSDAQSFASMERLEGIRVGRVRRLPAPNLNIVQAASIGFSGRAKVDEFTSSFAGECTRYWGAAAVNNVSVSMCFVADVQDLDAARADVRRMIASVARSI